MENPQKITSTIIETAEATTISTPKQKSWPLIIILSVISLQFGNGIIQSIFFAKDIPTIERILILILSITVLYFTLKDLLWQLMGAREIRITEDNIKLIKLSPLWAKTKTYRLSEIKSFDIRDDSVSEGPIAMLQLLRITDKIKIIFSYGYKTVIATSGIDYSEALEIKDLLNEKIAESENDIIDHNELRRTK